MSWLALLLVVCGCGCGCGCELEIGSAGGGEHWHQETFPSEIYVGTWCVMCLVLFFVWVNDDLFSVEIMVSSMQYCKSRGTRTT